MLNRTENSPVPFLTAHRVSLVSSGEPQGVSRLTAHLGQDLCFPSRLKQDVWPASLEKGTDLRDNGIVP